MVLTYFRGGRSVAWLFENRCDLRDDLESHIEELPRLLRRVFQNAPLQLDADSSNREGADPVGDSRRHAAERSLTYLSFLIEMRGLDLQPRWWFQRYMMGQAPLDLNQAAALQQIADTLVEQPVPPNGRTYFFSDLTNMSGLSDETIRKAIVKELDKPDRTKSTTYTTSEATTIFTSLQQSVSQATRSGATKALANL